MEVTKLTQHDQDRLMQYKFHKAPLGVIHPEHMPVTKQEATADFSDLLVAPQSMVLSVREVPKSLPDYSHSYIRKTSPTSKHPTQSQSQTQSQTLNRAQTLTKKASPERRNTQTLQQKRKIANMTESILMNLPNAFEKQKAFKRLSLISGKDLRNSLSQFKASLEGSRKHYPHIRQEWIAFIEEAFKTISMCFEQNKINELKYSEAKNEVLKAKEDYLELLWKEQILTDMLSQCPETLTLDDLEATYAKVQLDNERNILTVQNFLLAMKEKLDVNSASQYVSLDQMSYVARNLKDLSPMQCQLLSSYIDEVRKEIGFEQSESINFTYLENKLGKMLDKWEQEKAFYEAFIQDIFETFCYEFNLSKEALGPKLKSKKDLENKVVAEFLNQYLKKLQSSLEQKKKSIERLKYRAEHGKEMPKTWVEIMQEGKAKKESQEKQEAFEISKKASLDVNQKSSKKISPARKRSPIRKSPERKRPETAKPKSNVGKNTRPFSQNAQNTNSKQSIRKNPNKANMKNTNSKESLKISEQNPLDLSLKKDPEMDDLIFSLNPQKKAAKAPEKVDSPRIISKPKEMFNPFKSIEFTASINPERETVQSRVMNLKTVKETLPNPQSRSELISMGLKSFHPYMDRDGTQFDPSVKFSDVSAKINTNISHKYFEEVVSQSPNKNMEWSIKPHHLRSVTNHPFSTNDDPTYYKGKQQLAFKHISTVDVPKDKDTREDAMKYLEQTLEDLKCELHERKRNKYVNEYSLGQKEAWVYHKAGSDLTGPDKDAVVMESYEAILKALRDREKDLLNLRRARLYEVNRPPQDKWYELKGPEFSTEMHRNLVSLAPKKAQQELMGSLKYPHLY